MKPSTAAVLIAGIAGLVVLVITGHGEFAVILGVLGVFALMVL